MFVRPRSISACRMDDSEDRVCPDEIPWINRVAVVIRIARHARGIQRSYAAVSQRSAGRAAVQQGLVKIDTFLVFGGGSVRCVEIAVSGKYAVTRVVRGRRQNAVVGDIIEY